MSTGGDGVYGREQAWQLLTEWTQSESLRKHALAVEARVTAFGEAEADRLGPARPGVCAGAGRGRGALPDPRVAARFVLRAPSDRRRASFCGRARVGAAG